MTNNHQEHTDPTDAFAEQSDLQQPESQQAHPLRQPVPAEDDAHDLYPAWLAAQVPDLSTTRYEHDPIARCRFFTPDSNWRWYVLEAGVCENAKGERDLLFFGYVKGYASEFGYFSLVELQAVRGPMGLAIERDLYFEPRPLSQVIDTR